MAVFSARILKMLSAVTALFMIVAPVSAKWSIMAAGTPVTLKKSAMTVTPTIDWNRTSVREGKKSESWTLDGMLLNQISFYGGLGDGETLFKDRQKKERPLPKFQSSMLIPDIVDWFEASSRLVGGTALFEVTAVEPGKFAGHDGVRFRYNYVIDGDELKREGEAAGAIVGGKLYLITYEAPAIYYFDKNRADFEAMLGTVKIAG